MTTSNRNTPSPAPQPQPGTKHRDIGILDHTRGEPLNGRIDITMNHPIPPAPPEPAPAPAPPANQD